MTDDLSGRLRRLASTAADEELPDSATIRGRSDRRRRNHRIAGATSAVAAGLVAALVGVSLAGAGTERLSVKPAVSPSATTTPSSGPSATSKPEVTATPTPNRPTAAASEPSVEPSPAPVAPDSPGPEETPSPSPAAPDYVVGIHPSAAEVPTATDVDITVTVKSATDDFAVWGRAGEGSSELFSACPQWGDPPNLYVPSRTRSGDTTTIVFHWSWRQPGTYTLQAEVWGNCTDSTYGNDGILASAETSLLVSGGQIYTNGPHLPAAEFGYMGLAGDDPNSYPPDPPAPYYYEATADAVDFDGWMQRYTIDWGDGTPEETLNSDDFLEDCEDPGTHWIPGGVGGGAGYHHYPGPGTFTITVHAVSEDCTGNAQQVSTITRTITLT